MMYERKFFVRKAGFSDRVAVYFAEYRDGKYVYANSVTWEEITLQEQAEGIEAPRMLMLDPSEAQRLMDELWDCGFRPSEGTGSAGALAATQKHLEDMRKLTFDLIGRIRNGTS